MSLGETNGNDLTELVIQLSIEIHKELGSSLLETLNEAILNFPKRNWAC